MYDLHNNNGVVMLQKLPSGLRRKIANYFLKPSDFVDLIGVRKGDSILEIGMPVGLFANELLNKVGNEGKIYVAGPSQDSLSRLSSISKKHNLKLSLLSDVLTGEALKSKKVDKVVLTNLLSSTLKPDKFCLSLDQYLKDGSEIILIDWDDKFKNIGPLEERKVTKEDALKLMKRCGMKFKKLLNLSGYHYGIVFEYRNTK